MKKFILFITVFLTTSGMNAQTLIATSNNYAATAGHSQRKIVRDAQGNIYVIFTDFSNQERVVKGVMKNNSGEWSNPEIISNGKSPTLAISNEGRIHMVYITNDSARKVMHISSDNFSDWTETHTLSDSTTPSYYPISDVDAFGNLNVFWIQENVETGENLIYCRLNNDTIADRKLITTQEEINDIAIANHLQYLNNDIFFALQFNEDSLQFFRSEDLMNTYESNLATKGSQPNITYNSDFDYSSDNGLVRFLYRDIGLNLMEYEIWLNKNSPGLSFETSIGSVDYICIDDLIPPFGFSYLYLKDDLLYHNFSYGMFGSSEIPMETISGSAINYPSIAYKHFDPLYVDFIWMEEDSKIYYMRDEKHIWVHVSPEIPEGEGFTITGHPNPFSHQIAINVTVYEKELQPEIQIYTIRGCLVKTLEYVTNSSYEFIFKWDGTNQQGVTVESGIYFVVCTVGDKREAQKVMYK